MDIATIVGLIAALGLIVASILVGGGSFASFFDIPSMLVVVGGAIAAALIAFPLKSFLGVFKVGLKCVLNKSEDVEQIIKEIVGLAEIARKDGILALEGKIEEIEHPFIKMAIQMAVDGSPPEVIEDVLRIEVRSLAKRHSDGKSVMDQLGRFAPAYGMIGTLMGLIMMLSNMDDPSSIGTGMAVALITTLYGAIVSNVFFLPFAEKLGFMNKQELMVLEIAIRGIMAIQAGEKPRVIEQKLYTFLHPSSRPVED